MTTRHRGAVARAAAVSIMLTLVAAPPASADTADQAEATEPGGAVTVSEDAHPVPADVQVLDFAGAVTPEGAGTQGAGDGPAAGWTTATVSAEVPDLAVVGVSWDGEAAPADLVVELRSSTAGEWGPWEVLEVEDAAAEPGLSSRGGTEPLAVTGAQTVEARLTAAGDLPGGANLAVIDPGTSAADVPAPTATTTGGTTGAPMPTVYSRAQWGANEAIRTWAPEIGTVRGVVVHHTAGVNGYTEAQVPGIVRGIYAYHAEAWGRDWGDIGYNVLVDRFGRAWEGRFGGLHQAVIGAHATGMNGNMFGISVMGNFETTALPEAAMDTVARTVAWKFDLMDVNPHGSASFDGWNLGTVVGHRDVAQTTCPGQYIYPRLGELRNRIASVQAANAGRGYPVTGAIATFYRTGNNAAALGTATGDDVVFGGGTIQTFERGTVYAGPRGTWMTTGAIDVAYTGPGGSYGWPIGAQTCTGSSCSQTFERGTIRSQGMADGYYRVPYSDAIVRLRSNVTRAVSYVEWVAAGRPAPRPAPTVYERYAWADTLYGVTRWPDGTQVDMLGYGQWQRVGFPAARSVGWIDGSFVYQWPTNDELFLEGPDGSLRKLSYADWTAAGYRPPTVKVNEGFVKLFWRADVVRVVSRSAGTGRPVGYAEWASEGYPSPEVAVRFPGDVFYTVGSGSTIHYQGLAGSFTISYAQWAAAGFPPPTRR